MTLEHSDLALLQRRRALQGLVGVALSPLTGCGGGGGGGGG